MLFAGIDPGAKGAIVLLDSNEKTAHYWKIKYREDDLIDSSDLFASMPTIKNAIIYIEKIKGRGSSPTDMKMRWSAGANFGLGENYGKIRQIFEKYPHTLVDPKQWQKYAHIGTSEDTPKKRSKQAFVRLNPDTNLKHDGVIDAFFIARFALIKHSGLIYDNWNFIKVG
jgi:hypothetical protein